MEIASAFQRRGPLCVLPGPGGIIVFGAGATLVLKYSEWAKR